MVLQQLLASAKLHRLPSCSNLKTSFCNFSFVSVNFFVNRFFPRSVIGRFLSSLQLSNTLSKTNLLVNLPKIECTHFKTILHDLGSILLKRALKMGRNRWVERSGRAENDKKLKEVSSLIHGGGNLF